ncbi:hypothetical protein [Pseudobdellovibrio exovorus]|uniref:Tyrosine specific protein phosphatases domain-containing protein n=1 Tax=Pseudobdellovibrio exovorus JSS TaxID=1184267 RepID=M4V698_9BACT|nr:hypothetical protein [Pseudobdellovibrio exovorus]AGH94897.1 hypothetical protein A11Q_677 [Pseudobdellovibrio exovorus JSS]
MHVRVSLKLGLMALFFPFVMACQNSPAANATSNAASSPNDEKYQNWVESVRYYKKHFGLNDLSSKKVNNRGNGDQDLYGVRNFRVVLHGVYYRGGANNVYNKLQKRKNNNPLPNVALENLCKENFGTAFYFYTDNADQMQANTICETTASKSKNNINYTQITAFKESNQIELLRKIHQHIVDMNTKPIYGHCWNGWHASGLIASLSLMQFCHYTNEQALNYWIKNTDKNDAGYKSVKKRISTFKRIPELEIDEKFRKEICIKPAE